MEFCFWLEIYAVNIIEVMKQNIKLNFKYVDQNLGNENNILLLKKIKKKLLKLTFI